MPSSGPERENVLELILDTFLGRILSAFAGICSNRRFRNIHINNPFKIRNQDPSNTLRVLGEYSLTLARARILK